MRARLRTHRDAFFGALVGGVVLGLAYPPSPLPYLALVAWVPLLFAWRRAGSAREAWIYGIAFYAGCFSIAFRWPLQHAFAHVSAVSLLPMVMLVILLAVPLGLSRLVGGDPRCGRSLLAVVLLHLVVEAALSRGPFALPWPLAGHALSDAQAVRNLAAFGGVPLLSAWLLGVNAVLFGLLSGMGRRVFLVAGLVGLSGLGIAGSFISGRGPSTAPARNVAIVQPALPATVWADVDSRLRVGVLAELTDSLYAAAAARPDLTIWPETALPPCTDDPVCPDVRAYVRDLTAAPRPPLLAGAITPVPRPVDGAGHDKVSWHNASLLLSADSLLDQYAKVRLVPFAEAVPFAAQFPALAVLGVNAGGVAAYLPGQQRRPIDVSGFRIGTLICFESLFSQDVRDYVRQGADVLVVHSQNGWWGHTAGHAQHLAYTRIRAVESGLPVVFASASGPSAVIGSDGRILASIPYGQRGGLVVPIPPAADRPLFARAGDWVSFGALLALLGLIGQRIYARGRD